jgi:hypothetical protein
MARRRIPPFAALAGRVSRDEYNDLVRRVRRGEAADRELRGLRAREDAAWEQWRPLLQLSADPGATTPPGLAGRNGSGGQ